MKAHVGIKWDEMESASARARFVGRFDVSLDGRNRLVVPRAIQKKINPEIDGDTFVAKLGRAGRTLVLYPAKRYDAEWAPDRSLEGLSDAALEYLQFESLHCNQIEMDEQGRLVLPQYLVELVGFKKQVVLVGMGDVIEVWPKEEAEAFAKRYLAQRAANRPIAIADMREHLHSRAVSGASSSAGDETSGT